MSARLAIISHHNHGDCSQRIWRNEAAACHGGRQRVMVMKPETQLLMAIETQHRSSARSVYALTHGLMLRGYGMAAMGRLTRGITSASHLSSCHQYGCRHRRCGYAQKAHHHLGARKASAPSFYRSRPAAVSRGIAAITPRHLAAPHLSNDIAAISLKYGNNAAAALLGGRRRRWRRLVIVLTRDALWPGSLSLINIINYLIK